MAISPSKNEPPHLEERFLTLLENPRLAVFILGPGFRISYANEAAGELAGQPRDEVLGLDFLRFVDPKSLPLVEYYDQCRRRGQFAPVSYEFAFLRADGQARSVECTAHFLPASAPPPDPGPSDGPTVAHPSPAAPPAGANGTGETVMQLMDATERYAIEEELASSRETFKFLFENAPDAIFLYDTRGNVIDVNNMGEALLGYAKRELVGLNLLTTGLLPIDEVPKGAALLCRNYVGRPTGPDELVFQRRDGALVPVELTTHPIKFRGRNVGLGIARDISARKRAEEEHTRRQAGLEALVRERTKELEDAKHAADEASQAKSTFLAHMSHEIRTPINAIMGFSELMQRDESLTPSQRKQLDVISRSGEHLLALITDVLEMSKIEAGRVTLNPTTFDLRALLEDLEMMFRMRADAKKLAFTLEGLARVPRYVEGDEGKLRQVLLNLLGNAVKFTESGGITLKVKARHAEDGRVRLDAEVADTGPGIPAEEQRDLFKPFEQARRGRLMRSGTGLGLAICREFVTHMGGDIALDSRPGRGSVFKFHILLGEGDLGLAGKAAAEPRRVKRLAPGQPPRRVLVADDEELNQTFLCRLLGEVGFEARGVAGGAEAVAEFASWRPDLILLDMKMPGLDGLEAARLIRAAKGGAAVKIIIVSASAFVESRTEALEAGADDYLTKPFREDALFGKIARLLDVAYEYADAPSPGDGGGGVRPAAGGARPANLAGLSKAFLRKARAAVVQADYDAAMALIDGLDGRHASEAAALRGMVERFEYDRLLDLLTASQRSSR